MLKAKLVVVGGDPRQTEIELQLPTIIGRGREVGLTVPQALVSRRHSEVFEKNGRLFVRDLGSLNGTFVNNQRIDADQPLEPGQLLTLGTVTFRAIYQIGDDVQQPPVAPNDQTHSAFSSDTTEIARPEKGREALPLDTVDIDSIRPAEFASEQQKNQPPSNAVASDRAGVSDHHDENLNAARAFIDNGLDQSRRCEPNNSAAASSSAHGAYFGKLSR